MVVLWLGGCSGRAEAAPPLELADVYRATYQDTLIDVARRFDLGYVELVAANPGVDPWLPGEGRRIVLPTRHLAPAAAHRGIVINTADQRLYYYPSAGAAEPLSYPIGIGRQGWETPKGPTMVVAKREHPAWYPPASIREEKPELPMMIPPGPDNPLGDFALYLGLPGYLLHGTNKPYGVGRRVSHGCFRLYPEDISRLFPEVAIGTPVLVVDQPVKLGWFEGELYLEVHPQGSQIDEVEATGSFTPRPLPDLDEVLRRAAGSEQDRLDWSSIAEVAAQRRGIPTRISVPKLDTELQSRQQLPTRDAMPNRQLLAIQPVHPHG